MRKFFWTLFIISVIYAIASAIAMHISQYHDSIERLVTGGGMCFGSCFASLVLMCLAENQARCEQVKLLEYLPISLAVGNTIVVISAITLSRDYLVGAARTDPAILLPIALGAAAALLVPGICGIYANVIKLPISRVITTTMAMIATLLVVIYSTTTYAPTLVHHYWPH